ncbi:MAG: PAS domain-containing protein, partial [Candidatus Aureabacteria bacterium]|nr:PAS domain-containing protein [Candidatus Auribacterota bacterium]
RVILTEEQTISEKDMTLIPHTHPADELGYGKTQLIKLLSLSNKIYATLDIQEIMNALMDGIFEIFPSTEKSVFLLADSQGKLIPSAYRVKDEKETHIRLSHTILEKVKEKKSAVLSSNVMGDSDYKFSESILLDKIMSFMCSPMYIKDNLVGIFYIDTTRIDGAFTEDDLRFFLMICNQMAMSVYNARLYSEIKDLAQYNANILTSISSGIIVIDNDNIIRTFNRTSEEIFHLLADDVIGKNISKVSKLKVIEEAISQIKDSEDTSSRVEVSFQDEVDDQSKIIGLGISLLKDHNQYIKGIIAYFKDLTEINKLNQMLQRSERLAALGEMAAGVAHEIRNPLNSIRGFAQLFNEGMVTPQNTKEFSDIIIREVDRLNGLVVDLLDFSREQKIQKMEMDIRPLIDATIAYVRQGCQDETVEWIKNFPEESVKVGIDPDKIKQVFINLYQNALDACKEKQKKVIKTSLVTDKKDMLTIAVEDNGSGMMEGVLKKIFNPFYSTKKRGSGLGLPICQRIVEEHGGFIDAESQEGKGTIFRIYLPI